MSTELIVIANILLLDSCELANYSAPGRYGGVS